MGYYTEFNLECRDCSLQDVEKILHWLKENGLIGYVFCDGISEANKTCFWFSSWDVQKWDDHDEYMLDLSRVFPAVTFALYGDGEIWSDRWVTYYLNGKMSYGEADISVDYPPFDPSSLE